MGLFSLLGTARDGILAQSAALTTTGQNIANVSTPGYVRRRAVLESTQAGGVRVAMNQRTFDRFAFGHLVGQQSKLAAAEARSYALTEIETTLAPPNGSIGDSAMALVQAFNALAAFPVDPSLRADVIAKTQNLATTISSTAKALETTGENLLGRARDVVGEVNATLSQIADLNKQIATALGAGGDPSGLRDQRDLAIRQVGERVGAQAVEGPDGRVTLFAAGSVLVEGNGFSALSMDLDANGAMRFFVNGATKNEITSRIDTGMLGGLREARDVDLAKMRDKVDAYAFDLANAFNAVHSTGYGTDGVTGRDLFVPPATQKGAAASMAIDPALVDHPERIGAAASTNELPGGNGVALQLGNLGTAPAFGGTTLADRFADIATDIGLRKSAARAECELRTDTLSVAEQLEGSANAVSLEEEMVDLAQYQRAFEASTKVLRTVDELLKTLMESF
ncbi:MAG: flagellar hook-associated protein FlgK [Myxococcales bacterium 68-20]|nr:flagellar hook-associated protein FlgK [Myxococcales bacterium]OJY30277.1 MAG: flagellar hook-associated protein FlgK [Myxococcales bacterium 68-20]